MTDQQVLYLIREEIAKSLGKLTNFSDDDTLLAMQDRILDETQRLYRLNSMQQSSEDDE